VVLKVFELKDAASAAATEVGRGYVTHAQALTALKKHLKTFRVSGHNPDRNYWWVRDSEGLRKCWISSAE
jgi:hypothetical protein